MTNTVSYLNCSHLCLIVRWWKQPLRKSVEVVDFWADLVEEPRFPGQPRKQNKNCKFNQFFNCEWAWWLFVSSWPATAQLNRANAVQPSLSQNIDLLIKHLSTNKRFNLPSAFRYRSIRFFGGSGHGKGVIKLSSSTDSCGSFNLRPLVRILIFSNTLEKRLRNQS